MWLLRMPVRFLIRQGRWFARGAGVVVAGVVFEFLRRNDTVQLPGMTEPHEVGVTDPYWMAAVAYLAITWSIKRIINMFVRETGHHIQRLSRGDWFKR